MVKIKRICKQCEREFKVKASAIKNERGIFCSRKCQGIWRSGHIREKKHPNWKGGKIKRVCQECDKLFEVYPYKVKNGEGKFCSRECKNKWQSEHIRENSILTGNKKTPIICAICATTFFVTSSHVKSGQKCCSSKCRNENLKKREIRVCKWCGKDFETIPSRIKDNRGIFCSLECKLKWQSKIQTNNKEISEHLRQIRALYHIYPTKPERIFEEICERNILDFYYVGDGELWIGKDKKLNPDFIEANGKKICVEIMGAYWHSPLLNQKLREDRLLAYRKAHYKRYKWQPIFIWDTDLLRKDAEQFVLSVLKKEGIIHG